jgi:effector-binding domain-containing protein
MDGITTRRTLDQPVLAIRHAVPSSMFQAFMGGALEELYTFITQAEVEPEGPPMARYHAFGPDIIDVEVCLPVAAGTIGAGRITTQILPGSEVASVVHVGPYDREGEAYAALEQWIALHGHVVSGPPCERYLVGPDAGVSPAEYRTEIQMPIEAALVAVPS